MSNIFNTSLYRDVSSSDEDNDNQLYCIPSVTYQANTDFCNVAEPQSSSGKRKRSTKETSRKPTKFIKWTSDMDDLLREGVNMYHRDWVKVADHVQHTVTNDQCRHRWCEALDPAVVGMKRGSWTAEEENNLAVYVQTHMTKRNQQDIIDWTDAPKLLDRTGPDCQHKWTSIRQSQLRKGPFTEEEDQLIIQRVREWGNRGLGLWVEIEKELGRSSNNCNHRWKRYLKERVASGNVGGI